MRFDLKQSQLGDAPDALHQPRPLMSAPIVSDFGVDHFCSMFLLFLHGCNKKKCNRAPTLSLSFFPLDIFREVTRLNRPFSRHGSTLKAGRKDVVVVLFSWKGTLISFIIFHNCHRGRQLRTSVMWPWRHLSLPPMSITLCVRMGRMSGSSGADFSFFPNCILTTLNPRLVLKAAPTCACASHSGGVKTFRWSLEWKIYHQRWQTGR